MRQEDKANTRKGGSAGWLETPTLLIAIAIYGAWLVLTAFHSFLPLPCLAMAGGIVIAWHGSLQHETIHGHPTRSRWMNAAIGSLPLSLWLPYAVYRRTHIAHHETANITDSLDDPESQYLRRTGGIRFWLASVERTLAGRLILGPPIRIGHFLALELRNAAHNPTASAREWLPHILLVMLLLGWLRRVDLPVGTYILTFVYPGTALSLLRSFAEHRAHPDRQSRAAIVTRPGLFGLLFLNNNLHAVHHARPDLPWYALPKFHGRHREAFAAAPHYESYGAIASRHWLRPHDVVIHPDHAPGGMHP